HQIRKAAALLTSKVICDDTYSNKSWSIVAQGMFQLREINQVRRQYPSGHHLFVCSHQRLSVTTLTPTNPGVLWRRACSNCEK
ncbi:hypothetical protein DFJ58DRAFT_664362, partial [Suillus subalutaceus]|uniref:uncharacterized protein n=1 Tax=Suillus subalutaceus TaxID=48586 RepID=UPI001B8680BB